MDNLKENITASFSTFQGILAKITDKIDNGLIENESQAYFLYAIFGARVLSLMDCLNESMDKLKQHYKVDFLKSMPTDDLVKHMDDKDFRLLVSAVGKDGLDRVLAGMKDNGVH